MDIHRGMDAREAARDQRHFARRYFRRRDERDKRKKGQYREGWEEEARRKRNNCSDIPPRSSGASGVQSAARAEPPPIEPADASYA